MAIRTIQLLGMGFGSTPASVTATANGTQIFNGTVTTINQPVPQLPNPALTPDQVLLFSFEIDTAFTGTIPMNISVSNGTVLFGSVFANYIGVANPVYTPEQFAIINDPTVGFGQKVAIYTEVANPPFTAEEIAILKDQTVPYNPDKVALLNSHGCGTSASGGSTEYADYSETDPRIDVYIDGLAQDPDYSDLDGDWWWAIRSGSVLSYNLEITPAVV